MNWIKRYMDGVVLSKSFDRALDDLFQSYGAQLVDRFNITEPTSSYWIDCESNYPNAPEPVSEKSEFNGSLEHQSEFIINKHWEFFPASCHQDLRALLQYILYLRNASVEDKERGAEVDNEVRDTIYEM